MAPIFQANGLRFAYGSDAGDHGARPLIDDWSAAIAGGVALLYGDSGSGKTTLLRLLAGELSLAAGRFSVAGQPFAGDRASWRERVCWIDPATREHDALRPVEFLTLHRQSDAGFDEPGWYRHLEGFGLSAHLDKRFEQLSTGSRRKVWIATTLASAAPLALLDEPTAALDQPSIRYLWQALAALCGRRDRLVLVASFSHPTELAFDAVLTLADDSDRAR